MQLTDLQIKVEAFLAASGKNIIESPETISTDPVSACPLRLFDPPLLGVAAAQDPRWADLKRAEVVGPAHLAPEQWLPGARSVVSFFLPFSQRIRRANRIQGTTATEWLYGRFEGEMFVAALREHLAGLIQAAGSRALAPSSDPRFKVVNLKSNWSERHAAFIAGLGTFSLNRSLITRFGAAGRIGSVVTDAELRPTARTYEDPREFCLACGACISRCPCRAIDAEAKDNVKCKAWLDRTLAQYTPRYGCGKCQTGVPCEARVPQPETTHPAQPAWA